MATPCQDYGIEKPMLIIRISFPIGRTQSHSHPALCCPVMIERTLEVVQGTDGVWEVFVQPVCKGVG
jgi:hypothetical protein